MSQAIALRELVREDLVVIEAWFRDPETRRWLGDEAWPRQLFDCARRSPGRLALVATTAQALAGVLDVDRHADGRAAVALVVDPSRRREGIASVMLAALVRGSAGLGIVELFGGVEVGNAASLGLMGRAGFEQVTDAPDAEGFTYFARRTDHTRLLRPWLLPGARL